VKKRIDATPSTGLDQGSTLQDAVNPGTGFSMVCGPRKTGVALELAPSRTKEKAIPHQDILLRCNRTRVCYHFRWVWPAHSLRVQPLCQL